MMIVAITPSLIWPTKKPAAGRLSGSADSAVVRDSTARPAVERQPTAQPPNRPTADSGRTVWVTSPLYRLGFSTHGARLVSAELLQYQSFAPGDSAKPVQLVPRGDAFLRHRLVLPSGDTVSLADWDFQPSADAPAFMRSPVGRGATDVCRRYRDRRLPQRKSGIARHGLDHDAGAARRDVPVSGLRRAARFSPSVAPGPRSRRRQPVRWHLPADHSAGLANRPHRPAVDARTSESGLRLGADSVRYRRAHTAVAPEPEGDGVGDPHAGGRAAHQRDAG